MRTSSSSSASRKRCGPGSRRERVATGYQKGFHTIVDANVVTAITALVLFAVATAQVKGFALMLLVGTVVSVLTAVVATRAMLGLLAGFRWFDNPRFMGAEGRGSSRCCGSTSTAAAPPHLALDRDGGDRAQRPRRRRQGLNFGIDFKGGTQITFRTDEPWRSRMRSEMDAIGRGDAVVQGRGESAGGDRYTSFQVHARSP